MTDTPVPTGNDESTVSRREFLTLAGSVATASLVNVMPGTIGNAEAAPTTRMSPPAGRSKKPNILFVLTDQERYIKQFPRGFVLPGHDRLKRQGVTFHNHYCPAVMCTSSRAVLMTGLQTADNRMFENADMPYVGALSTKVPTIGHMLRQAGYYTAYKGKWHLNPEFDSKHPDRFFDSEMDAYGFSDFGLPIDGLAHELGGHKQDEVITSSAVSWLRDKGRSLNAEGKPWMLFVGLINPHDIMYFNTDAPGENVQDTGKLMMTAARAPEHALYKKRWHAALPANLRQPINSLDRPRAHAEFDRAWGYTLGNIPPEDHRWQRFSDFYFNSLRSVDMQLVKLLDELDALGLQDDTIVIFTADHGEMGGAHGMRGKGPMAYQEILHIPMMISHPGVKGGQDCKALTSHIDLAPSLLAMAGVDKTQAAHFAGRELPGKDISTLLKAPASAGVNAARDSVLFTYSGLATNDSELIRIIAEAKAAGADPKAAVKAAGYRPNLKKRGSLRTVFDGRYKFTRYFSPIERNSPRTLDELFHWNDVELFDLKTDPSEMKNLAMEREQHKELLMRMNDKLEAAIKAEIGADDGREMPNVAGVDWRIDRIDL